MSKYGAPSFSVFLVDGYNLIASVMENATISKELLTQQTNPFGVTTESHTPIGIFKGVLVCGGGLFDETSDALHASFTTLGATTPSGSPRIVCAALYGNTPGKPFMGFEGAYEQKYERMDSRDGLTKADVVYQVTGSVDEGQIVQDLATFTADWDTKTGGANAADTPVDYTTYDGNRSIAISGNTVANPTVVTTAKAHGLTTGDKVLISGSNSTPTIDGSRTVTVVSATTFTVAVNVTVLGSAGSFVKVNTNAGGVGYAHCTAFSGFSGLVLKIMHSPDDTTYAALVTFTTIAGITKERVTVSGNVDRYLSSNGDVTGSGSVTVFSGFCRN